jgi:rhodanese-related sulfurtransferase
VSQPTRRFHLPSALRPTSLRIEAEAARTLIEDQGALLVDVRRQDDPTSPLDGAVRVAPDEVPGRIAAFPRDVPIVLACT